MIVNKFLDNLINQEIINQNKNYLIKIANNLKLAINQKTVQ